MGDWPVAWQRIIAKACGKVKPSLSAAGKAKGRKRRPHSGVNLACKISRGFNILAIAVRCLKTMGTLLRQ